MWGGIPINFWVKRLYRPRPGPVPICRVPWLHYIVACLMLIAPCPVTAEQMLRATEGRQAGRYNQNVVAILRLECLLPRHIAALSWPWGGFISGRSSKPIYMHRQQSIPARPGTTSVHWSGTRPQGPATQCMNTDALG